MADNVQLLLDMGFTRERAEHAVSVTGNAGVEAAAEWLLSHSEDDGTSSGHTLGAAQSAGAEDTTPAASNPPQQPLSLKCDECGKLLRSEIEVQTHAARTQHVNFSESTEEIKPLTAQERKEQAEKLQEKIKQRRAEREAKEKEEEKHREKVRRKTGQEMTQIRHEMEMKEAKKIAEQKRREKMEEQLARKKVLDDIARDRASRAERDRAEKQSAEPNPPPHQTETQTVAQPKKEYDTCKLQIRLFGGKTLVNTFNAMDALDDVTQYIMNNRTDGDEPFALMTSFPRRVFNEEESSKTLNELGLVPSSVVILTKRH